jgi:hypothetical protein
MEQPWIPASPSGLLRGRRNDSQKKTPGMAFLQNAKGRFRTCLYKITSKILNLKFKI